MAVFDELQTSRSDYVALLAMAEYPDLMTAALQFTCDAEQRCHRHPHVTAKIPAISAPFGG
jgi:hypothetical protein